MCNTKNLIKNNNSDLNNNEFKTNIKVKGINNNIIINKFNLIFNKSNHNNKSYTKMDNKFDIIHVFSTSFNYDLLSTERIKKIPILKIIKNIQKKNFSNDLKSSKIIYN